MKEKFENALSGAITDIIDGKPLTLDNKCFEGLSREHKSFIFAYLHSIGMCDFQNLVDNIDKLVPCSRWMLPKYLLIFEELEVFAVTDSDIESAVNEIEWYGCRDTAEYFKKLQNKKHIYRGYVWIDDIITCRPPFGYNNKGWVYVCNKTVKEIDEVKGE